MSQHKETDKEVIEPFIHPIEYGKEHPVNQALNVGSLIAGGFAGADEAAVVKSGMGKLADKITGTFAEKPTAIDIENASNAVQNSLNKAKTMAEGKLNAVKKQFSTPPNFEDISDVGESKPSLKDLKTKFLDYFNSRAPKMEEDVAGATTKDITAKADALKSPLPPPPKVEVYSKGTMGKGTPNEMTIWGVKGAPEEVSKLGYGPEPGSIPENILQKHGLLPKPGEVTVPGPKFNSPQEEIEHLINLTQGL